MHARQSAVAIWGDPIVLSQKLFPTWFDLVQRPSGRWQLLVVNRTERDRIEFFELRIIASSGRWCGRVCSVT